LEDYIVSFDDIVSSELCDRVVKEYENSYLWNPTQVGSGAIDTTIRNVDAIGISFNSVMCENEAARKEIDALLFACASVAIRKYNDLFPEAKIEEDSGYDLLRYEEGQYYKQHTDSYKKHPRAVSCSFALNDDYEGGEWGFFDNEIKIKPKKGSVVMFPSNFMYPHQINTVTKGTRYSIVTWFI
jgi:predicted 2-oxoglutarate/Fe(II)-dependent dioxygenase YbiX